MGWLFAIWYQWNEKCLRKSIIDTPKSIRRVFYTEELSNINEYVIYAFELCVPLDSDVIVEIDWVAFRGPVVAFLSLQKLYSNMEQSLSYAKDEYKLL
jgi:hypothetical protein